MKKVYFIYLLVVIAAFSCKKPYLPQIKSASGSYLVVEGIINSGSDSTIIKLSKTVHITDAVRTNAESGATVTVEGEGFSKLLSEISPGVYAVVGLNLNAAAKYHLSIKLLSGQQYLSDDVAVKITPPIDTVSYAVKNNQLQIYASSHDPSSNTHYYRWSYDETWRFHAKYISNYKLQNNSIVRRGLDDDVFTCFGNAASNVIVLASTNGLAQDLVSNAPITQIMAGSEKISIRYSINIKEYALTQDAFAFWQNLKKNTEQLGSIFDALPSQLKGNIHNVADANEPVIGYIGVSTIQQKRIFIDQVDLPNEWLTQYPFDCGQDTALYNNPKTHANEVADYLLSGISLPTFAVTSAAGVIIGYGRTSYECGDCTIRGTKPTPFFWKDK